MLMNTVIFLTIFAKTALAQNQPVLKVHQSNQALFYEHLLCQQLRNARDIYNTPYLIE